MVRDRVQQLTNAAMLVLETEWTPQMLGDLSRLHRFHTAFGGSIPEVRDNFEELRKRIGVTFQRIIEKLDESVEAGSSVGPLRDVAPRGLQLVLLVHAANLAPSVLDACFPNFVSWLSAWLDKATHAVNELSALYLKAMDSLGGGKVDLVSIPADAGDFLKAATAFRDW
jgi:hypothetical protein